MEMAMLRDAALLRHFLVVAAERSISAAAQRLALSQPALTKSIRKLEARFGAPLFERLPRGVALTALGETLLPHARRIEAECQFAETEMRALRGGRTGRLRLGAGPLFGDALLPRAIARLHQSFPELRVELDVDINEATHPRLFEGELDAVFCRLPEPAELPPSILRREFFEIELRIVAGDGHPLLAKSRVTARDLSSYPWVVYHQDREMISQLFTAVRGAGAKPLRVGTEVKSLFALIQLLRAGPYLSCVADSLIKAYPALGLRFVPFGRFIWRFPGGALIQRALESYLPVITLVDLVREEAMRLRQR
jgi:DNA-binding transcriptional LysR family regulator